jgi:hypothetical protein
MSFTNYLENQILDEVFGGVNYAPPATLYIGLSSTPLADDGTGYTEPPTAAGYARRDVTNNATNWPATGGDGTKANGTPIAFNTATGDWGAAVTHFFIADAATGGTNILAYGTLGTAKTIGNGDTASFAAGALTITLD